MKYATWIVLAVIVLVGLFFLWSYTPGTPLYADNATATGIARATEYAQLPTPGAMQWTTVRKRLYCPECEESGQRVANIWKDTQASALACQMPWGYEVRQVGTDGVWAEVEGICRGWVSYALIRDIPKPTPVPTRPNQVTRVPIVTVQPTATATRLPGKSSGFP